MHYAAKEVGDKKTKIETCNRIKKQDWKIIKIECKKELRCKRKR